MCSTMADLNLCNCLGQRQYTSMDPPCGSILTGVRLGKRLTGAIWGQGIHGVVPVDLGAPGGPVPVVPGRTIVTMQKAIPRRGLGECRGSLGGRNPSGGDYWSRGSGEFGPGVPRRWRNYGTGAEAPAREFTFR